MERFIININLIIKIRWLNIIHIHSDFLKILKLFDFRLIWITKKILFFVVYIFLIRFSYLAII